MPKDFSTYPAPHGEFVLSDGSHPVVWPRRITGTVGRWMGLSCCGKEVPAHYKSEMESLEGCSIGKVSDRVGFWAEGSE